MKLYVITLICILFVSCNEKIKVKEATLKKEVIVKQKAKELIIDPIEEPEKNIFPKWMQTLYPIKDSLSPYELIEREYLFFERINDSVSYCMFQENDGICSIDNLSIFKYYELNFSEQINVDCDMDLSQTFYSWVSYTKTDSLIFRVVEYEKYIPDSLLSSFQEDTTIEDVEDIFQYDSSITFFEILNTGEIKKTIL